MGPKGKRNHDVENDYITALGEHARKKEGHTEVAWAIVEINGPVQSCNIACVLFVLVAMYYLHETGHTPDEEDGMGTNTSSRSCK